MADLKLEWPVLRAAALAHGVDPFLLCAIRLAENGGVGKEMGVLDPAANTFGKQAQWCANTIGHYIMDYTGNPLIRGQCKDGTMKVMYSLAFIAAVARRYAPVGAGNDPTNLNANWNANVHEKYYDFTESGMDVMGEWSLT